MRIAICCPGPSLAFVSHERLAAYDKVICVNRAIRFIKPDYWAFVESEIYTANRTWGHHKLFTIKGTLGILRAQGCKLRDPVTFESLMPEWDHVKTNWTRFTATACSILAANLGATLIDYFGADMIGEADFDGSKPNGAWRTEERWRDEKAICQAIVRFLGDRGVETRFN